MFDDDVLEELADEKQREVPPVFIAFYSGGFYKDEGVKLVDPVIQAVRDCGLSDEDTLVLHHPDGYGMEGSGYDPYPAYLDRLEEEIDKVPTRRGRRLILFGHSRGMCPAFALACRLGVQRVVKIYVLGGGAIIPGYKTGWEHVSDHFKTGGDDLIVKWLASMQPDNLILKKATECNEKQLEAMMVESKWLTNLITLTRLQYKFAMFPEPNRDLKVTDVPIMGFILAKDPGAQRKDLEHWSKSTTAKVELVELDSGHMDCLSPQGGKGSKVFPLGDIIGKDIKKCFLA
mmetsp:Transcript_166/g.255  ORF Transcript_166/g.255 Transcript_166/m.255 type:complete len:288 (-) Transcript_166:62-925(-)